AHTHNDLSLESLRGDLAAHHARVGDAREGSRGPGVVDEEFGVRGQGRRGDARRLGQSINVEVEARPFLALEFEGELAPADEGITVRDDVHRTPGGGALAE